MDFENLYNLIPKSPEQWDILDTLNWLDFIGLSNYKN